MFAFQTPGLFKSQANTIYAQLVSANIFTGALTASSQLLLPGVITASITADQNDYAPTGIANASRIRISSDQDSRVITGLSGGAEGRVIVIENTGSYIINFPFQSSSSAAANRFNTHSSLTITMAPGDLFTLIWNTTSNCWHLKDYGNSPTFSSVTTTLAYPGSPANGDLGYDTVTLATRTKTPIGDASLVREWNKNQSASSAIANTTVKTDFSVTTTIPANSLSAGTTISYRKTFLYSNTATPTLELWEVIGSTNILDTTAITTASGVTSQIIIMDVSGLVTAIGAAGSITWTVRLTMWSAIATITKDQAFFTTTASQDTTGALIIKSQAQWSAASASNTIVQEPFVVRS